MNENKKEPNVIYNKLGHNVHQWVECSCHTLEHTMALYHDDDHPELHMFLNLKHRPFHKRVWYGIKYIFGGKCRFGMYDDFLIDENSADVLIKELQRVKERADEFKKKNSKV